MAVGLIAFGLGALAGTILPSTQTEKRMAPSCASRSWSP